MKRNPNQQEYETIAREYGRILARDMFDPDHNIAIARYYSRIFNVRLSGITRALNTIKRHKETKSTANSSSKD